MANQIVRVKRETIESCMTCPLCNKLFRDATTISECLHTFCRKCIYDKISDEEIENCPICDIDLGCVPLEKLRPDHNLQDLRAKVFPIKGRKKVTTPENEVAITLPIRRKERSLSSLVVSTPRVSSYSSMTGRRTKGVSRKGSALRGSGFSVEKHAKKDEDEEEEDSMSSSSNETRDKPSPNARQSSVSAEPSQQFSNKESKNGSEPWDGKLDLWKPLNCLVEVAHRTKSSKSNVRGSENKVEPSKIGDSENNLRRAKINENKHKLKIEDERNTDQVSSENMKPKRLRRVRRKKDADFGEFTISPQAVLDSTTATGKLERRNGPIWFSLVASEDQERSTRLPQICSSYLRIKDGSLPVSFIQKYLMMKLELTSEAEVEIKCMGQPVVPTLKLQNLIDLWLQSSSTSERISATIGSSAKDFVMVLAYARKQPDST